MMTQPILSAMPRAKRKFTDEQKLQILREAEASGIIAALRDHKLSYSVFARWREKFLTDNIQGQGMISRHKVKSELRQVMEENSRLKKIIAEMALEIERKDEELKRNNPLYSRR